MLSLLRYSTLLGIIMTLAPIWKTRFSQFCVITSQTSSTSLGGRDRETATEGEREAKRFLHRWKFRDPHVRRKQRYGGQCLTARSPGREVLICQVCPFTQREHSHHGQFQWASVISHGLQKPWQFNSSCQLVWGGSSTSLPENDSKCPRTGMLDEGSF